MDLRRVVVAAFSDIANFFYKSRQALLLLSCPFCSSSFPVILAYMDKKDIIIDLINTVGKCIFFAFGVISQAVNCSLEIMSESLAFLD
jgi:hypothetical protein